MAEAREIGYFGEQGAIFREDLFGSVQKGRYGAFNEFLVNTQCTLLGILEVGSRGAELDALANAWAFSRGFNGCYSGTPPTFVKGVEGEFFPGGQCDVLYLVTFEFDLEVSGSFTTAGTFLGPIGAPIFEPADGVPGSPNQFGAGRVVFGSDRTVQSITSGSVGEDLVGFRILMVSRDDGMPDDCGDSPDFDPQYPPGQELPPMPNIGDVIAQGVDIEVLVQTGAGDIPVTIEVGDVTYCDIATLCTTVDGIPHRIRPDGGIDVLPYEPGQPGDTPTDSELLDEINEALNAEISGDLMWEDCEEMTIQESFSGVGFVGIQAMLSALLSVVNRGSNEYCPLLAEDEFMEELLETTSLSATQVDDYSDVTLSPDTTRVVIDIVGTANPYAVRRGSAGGNDNEQGRFGVISGIEEIDGAMAVKWTENQYYSEAEYIIDEFIGGIRKIRVSLRAGSTAQIKEYR